MKIIRGMALGEVGGSLEAVEEIKGKGGVEVEDLLPPITNSQVPPILTHLHPPLPPKWEELYQSMTIARWDIMVMVLGVIYPYMTPRIMKGMLKRGIQAAAIGQ